MSPGGDARAAGSRSSSRGRKQQHHRTAAPTSNRRDSDYRRGDRYPRRRGDSRDDKRRSSNTQYRGPGLSGPLMSYKSFMEMQRTQLDAGEAQRQYDEYRLEHDKAQAEIFFSGHSAEAWFREKYDPELAHKWQLEKQALSRELAERFVEFFVDGGTSDSRCNGLCLDQDPSKDYDRVVNGGNVEDVLGAPLFGFDAN